MTDSASLPLRVGIIGAGGIVLSRHLPGLKALPDVEIVAVANSTLTSAKAFCTAHVPDATAVETWQELIADPEIDIVWIGTPPYMHAPLTLAAIEANKHVFCQARMAMDAAEAVTMLMAATNCPHLVTMLCPPPHGLVGDAMMRELLENQAIGSPHTVRLRSLNAGFADPKAAAHWRQRSELSGQNVLTLGIYVEVLQRWLGPIATVMANGRVLHGIRDDYEVQVPDVLTVLCDFSSGVTGTLEFSSIADHAPGDTLEIYGTEGTLVYDFGDESISLGKKDGELKKVAIPQDKRGSWQVEADFINAVRDFEASRPHPDFNDGLHYMRVVSAVANSLESGMRMQTGNSKS